MAAAPREKGFLDFDLVSSEISFAKQASDAHGMRRVRSARAVAAAAARQSARGAAARVWHTGAHADAAMQLTEQRTDARRKRPSSLTGRRSM
jgi:hypothetical protein